MINIIRILAAIMLLALSGCAGNSFKIEFELPTDVNATFRIVYYASDKKGGITLETVAVVTNGKGNLKCPARNPSLIYLYTGSSQTSPLALYAERGNDIRITGQSADPYSWTAEGNEINKELSAWRNSNAKILSGNDTAEKNRAIASFVTANPESPVATILLLTSFSRIDNETLFRRLWLSLKGEAADRRWTELAARADIPAGKAPTPGKLRSMTVRSLGNGTDTIRPDSAEATILFFWHNGLADRKQRIDSIRALSKEFPDSARRIIGDVCLDPDSIVWRSPLRSDSLSNVTRLWMPAGLADRRLIQLAVTRSPFYIVFSQDGHQRYRGDDTGEALSAFREIISKE